MFNLIMLALPGFVKGKLPVVLKYAKWLGIIAVVIGVLFTAGSIINSNITNAKKQREQELVQKAELIVTQEKKIEEQKRELEQIKQVIEELKQSHEQTLATVKELKQEQKKIEITVTKKKKTIDNALKQIDTLDIPEADKDSQKSAVLIKGLNETYCELFKDSCNPGVN